MDNRVRRDGGKGVVEIAEICAIGTVGSVVGVVGVNIRVEGVAGGEGRRWVGG